MIRILLLLLFMGCQPKPSVTVFEGFAMTIPYRITIGQALANHEIRHVEDTIQKTFSSIDTIYNKWNPKSEVSKLNRLKEGQVVQLSEPLYSFLRFTDKIVHLTNGLFDPTVESKDGKIGWHHISMTDGNFSKSHDSVQLDLSGIVKGYLVDEMVEALSKLGYKNLLVDWGGELKGIGYHPESRPWRVFISRFGSSNPERAIATLDLTNTAIATSGDYLQQHTINLDGETKTITHIINPHTKNALEVTKESIGSVSILASSCAVADALATAAMLFSTKSGAENWLEGLKGEYPELQYWVITHSESGSRGSGILLNSVN